MSCDQNRDQSKLLKLESRLQHINHVVRTGYEVEVFHLWLCLTSNAHPELVLTLVFDCICMYVCMCVCVK